MGLLLLLLMAIMGWLVMAVAQVTMPSGVTQSGIVTSLLEIVPEGDLYVGEGSYTAVQMAAVFDGMDNVATELAANYDQINGDMMIEASDISSEQAMHEVCGNNIPGNFKSSISIGLVGVNNDQASFFESDAFGATTKTFVIVDANRNDIIVLNGVRPGYDPAGKGAGVFTGKLKAGWAGPLGSKVSYYRGLPAEAPS